MEFENREQWIRSRTKGSILDVACGCSIYYWEDGKHIEEDVKYLGLDRYRDPKNTGPGVPDNFGLAHAESLPIKSNSFDTVVVAEILEYFEDPREVLSEAYRVASQQVLVTVTDEDNWAVDIEFDGVEAEHPVRKYSIVELVKACVEACVSVEHISYNHTKDFPLAFHLVHVDVQ